MTETEQKLHELQMALHEAQGEQIEALRHAFLALQKAHLLIGQMLRLTAAAPELSDKTLELARHMFDKAEDDLS